MNGAARRDLVWFCVIVLAVCAGTCAQAQLAEAQTLPAFDPMAALQAQAEDCRRRIDLLHDIDLLACDEYRRSGWLIDRWATVEGVNCRPTKVPEPSALPFGLLALAAIARGKREQS